MIHSVGKNRNGNGQFSIFDNLAQKGQKKAAQTALKTDIPDEDFSKHTPEIKSEVVDARLKRFANDPSLRKNQSKNRDWVKKAEEQIVRPDNNEMVGRGSSSKILSQSGSKGVTNNVSSKKVLGGAHQPSIWNPNVIEESSQKQSNDEKTATEKQNIARLRNGIRKESLDEMAKAISQTDTRKACGVRQTGEFRGSNSYQAPKRGMSIFDFANNFERVPAKTEGEKLAEQVRKPKAKDTSWRGVEAQRSRRSSSLNRLFDSLMQEREQKEGDQ